jgi:hypothetical protein
MSMYEQFKTDESLETAGVYLDYGKFRIKIARAGGANKKFARVMAQKVQPYRRAIQTETMDDELANRLLVEAYAQTVVLGWQVQDADGEWSEGLEGPDRTVVTPTTAAVVQVFNDLPDLFRDVIEQANRVALFRKTEREEDAKN